MAELHAIAQPVPHTDGRAPSRGAKLLLGSAYGLLGLIVCGYLVTVLVRSAGSYSRPLDGWLVDGVELSASVLCFARGFLRRSGRAVAVILGCALLSWCLGDIALTLETHGGVAPSGATVADIFYLGFYPLAYIAVVIVMRGEVRRLATPSWLDGAIAGLGAAAACAAFAFRGLLQSAGNTTAATIVNLAYPIGDLLLLGLVVGATALVGGARRAPWALLGVGLALNAVGDTANLFQHSLGSSIALSTFNAIAWPASMLMMSIAVWLRPRGTDPLGMPKPPSFVIPELAAATALAILITGTLHAESRVSLALAGATLAAVGVRLSLSVRGLRAVSEVRHRQSLTDELTGLMNRRYLFSVLDAYFADLERAAVGPLAFLYIDLDGFKEINDSFGHPAGDELLRRLGPRLTQGLRATDVAVRIGGDELAVVLTDADAAYADAVAQRITDTLRTPFRLGSVEATIGASIGIAFAPADARDGASLVWCADVAMYRAKLGRVPYAVFEPDLDEEDNRFEFAQELRIAVDDDQLLLHFQPQLDLRTGRFSAVEALVRWAHPRLGLLAPLKFLPIAEEAGLITPITMVVLDKALEQCAAWADAGTPIPVSVNVSATDLLDPAFTQIVQQLLDAHGVAPACLSLELTETSIISDLDTSRRVIATLRELGVVVSIDDFGAGFTSLAHLNTLAVGELKLDRGFIADLAGSNGERDRELVRSTIDLAHALGLRVVAEGVEDAATLELLRTLHCDRAQGYVISKPKPGDALRLPPGESPSSEPVCDRPPAPAAPATRARVRELQPAAVDRATAEQRADTGPDLPGIAAA